MLAELYTLYFFGNSFSAAIILDFFLDAYGPIDLQDSLDTMMYCGVHIIIWPCRTEFSEYPKLKECIQFACEVLDNAYNGNVGWFNQGLFRKLFRQTSYDDSGLEQYGEVRSEPGVT